MTGDIEELIEGLEAAFRNVNVKAELLAGPGDPAGLIPALQRASARTGTWLKQLFEAAPGANELLALLGDFYSHEAVARPELTPLANTLAKPFTGLVHCLAPAAALACLASRGKYRLAIVPIEEAADDV